MTDGRILFSEIFWFTKRGPRFGVFRFFSFLSCCHAARSRTAHSNSRRSEETKPLRIRRKMGKRCDATTELIKRTDFINEAGAALK